MHSTWTGYRFNLAQNTADNSSAGQVVAGPRLPVIDLMALDTVAVRLSDGSRTRGQGVGADADGHPLDAVARLARELAANDQRLDAGDLVITGGLTAACALEVGGRLVGGGRLETLGQLGWRLCVRERYRVGTDRLRIKPTNERLDQRH